MFVSTVMRFIGITITDIKHNPYNKKVIMLGSKSEINAQLGDVASYNHDEYIYDGFSWQLLTEHHTKQETCCENRLKPKEIKPMSCEKCGAPLKGYECEYCGTRYYIPNNDALAQTKQELSQAQFDVANQVKLNEIQNMVDQLRMLGGNGSIEHMLSSGAVNIATARDMYAVKMASCFSD